MSRCLGLGWILLHAKSSETLTGMMYNPIVIKAARLKRASKPLRIHAIASAPRRVRCNSAVHTARVTISGITRMKMT